MSENHVEKHYYYLIHHLRAQIKEVIRYLHSEETLESYDTEKILIQAADTMKVRHLLDIVVGKNRQHIMDVLYAATLYAQIWPAADVLDASLRPHKNLQEQPEPLPEKWPLHNTFESFMKDLKVKTVDELDHKSKTFQRLLKIHDNPIRNNAFEMKIDSPRRALVINNHNFKGEARRDGTEKDLIALQAVLPEIGFEVTVEEDKTAMEMDRVLAKECLELSKKECQCFMLIILSHGVEGHVFGIDDKTLEIEYIIRKFSKIKTLAKVPKVVIIQACRSNPGDVKTEEAEVEKGEQSAAQSDQSGKSEESEDKEKATGPEQISESQSVPSEETKHDGLERDKSDIEADAPGKMTDVFTLKKSEDLLDTELSNFLLALPTTEGNYAWRPRDLGTWYIQALVYVIANYAYKEDFFTLMEKVNGLVRLAGEANKKEIPEVQTTFMKKLYFYPGLKQSYLSELIHHETLPMVQGDMPMQHLRSLFSV